MLAPPRMSAGGLCSLCLLCPQRLLLELEGSSHRWVGSARNLCACPSARQILHQQHQQWQARHARCMGHTRFARSTVHVRCVGSARFARSAVHVRCVRSARFARSALRSARFARSAVHVRCVRSARFARSALALLASLAPRCASLAPPSMSAAYTRPHALPFLRGRVSFEPTGRPRFFDIQHPLSAGWASLIERALLALLALRPVGGTCNRLPWPPVSNTV